MSRQSFQEIDRSSGRVPHAAVRAAVAALSLLAFGCAIGAGPADAPPASAPDRTARRPDPEPTVASAAPPANRLIAVYLDRQAREIGTIPEARIETGRADALVVIFQSDVLFASEGARLDPDGAERLKRLAETLRRYPDTDIIIRGHTDSTAGATLSNRLTDQRAEAVRLYLVAQEVAPHRLKSIGLGESQPVATNATPAGRKSNRRVEVELRPNAALRKRATGRPDADS